MAMQVPPASAHPLGNLSVNTFSRLVVGPDSVAVEVVVDAAEVPTLQAFPDVNMPRGGVSPQQRAEYEQRECSDIRDSIELAVRGTAVELDVETSGLTFNPGSAGLRTSRLTCQLATVADIDTIGAALDYRIAANADRVGWREVVAVGSGVALEDSDVPRESVSDALTNYPKDLLSSPPDQQTAHLSVVAGTGDGAPPEDVGDGSGTILPRGVDRFTSAFTDLVARQELGLGFGLLAVLAAMALGALHAFAPGHGKTVMAAYLVGREGSFQQAAIVGLSVTATHTLGVLALGIALTGAGLASPERVYPWLGMVSGLLLAAIGVALLVRQRPGQRGQSFLVATPDEHDHHHEGEADPTAPHRHGLFSHTHMPPARNIRGLVAIGFAGGLVPSPSALLVLLGGIALGRAWFGIVLVIAYGIGMAAALIGTGLLMVSARDLLKRFVQRRNSSTGARQVAVLLGRGLPTITASVVVLVGLGLAVRSITQI